MLNTDAHPFVVFQPYPAALALDLSSSVAQHVQIKGDLQVSGVTRSETFALDVRLKNGQLAVAGSATVVVLDFGVEVPQGAGGFVSVDPRITLEVSLILIRQ
jgi:polyisoprenoid-binding protein YceI